MFNIDIVYIFMCGYMIDSEICINSTPICVSLLNASRGKECAANDTLIITLNNLTGSCLFPLP